MHAESEIRRFEAFADFQKAMNDYRVSVGSLQWEEQS